MQLTFLGTAAANAYPEAFCCCTNCEQARALGGPSLRKRSAALVNDDLLLTRSVGAKRFRPRPGHPHGRGASRPAADQRPLLPANPRPRRPPRPLAPPFAQPGLRRGRRAAAAALLGRLAEALARDMAPGSLFDPTAQQQLNVELHPVAPLAPFTIGPYTALALPANHDPSVEPLLYVIQAAGRCIFYGTDTAALSESVWQTFHAQRLRFDMVVLDHTYGPGHPGDDHLSARDVAAYAARLRDEGLLAENGRVLATHIAHDANPPHPELAAYAVAHGYEIAYDGLAV